MDDAPEAAFDPDALLPRTDLAPQLNEVRPPYPSSHSRPALPSNGFIGCCADFAADLQAIPQRAVSSHELGTPVHPSSLSGVMCGSCNM